MVAELRRARYGYLLALHLLLLCAAGRTPSEIAAVLFCSRSSVYRVVKAYRAGTLTFAFSAAEEAKRARVRVLTPTLQRSLLAILGTVPWACAAGKLPGMTRRTAGVYAGKNTGNGSRWRRRSQS
jgi:hypothetical protein